MAQTKIIETNRDVITLSIETMLSLNERRIAFENDPHDMDLLEEVEDLTDLESESFAVFNE